ncbi:MAG: TetR family transcriptional regulator [Hyphomicrobiales bacterium]|nr:MAG: TetR family transcriptional regulator [Hyphomicrobiales bacterium]
MARVRADDYNDKRDAIRMKAALVLANAGGNRASMDHIARECGVSKALLYHYYDGKNDLIFDIISTHLTGIEEALAGVDRSGTSEQTLRSLCVALLEQYKDADDLHRVQMNSLNNLPKDQAAEIRQCERRIVDVFTNVIIEFEPKLKQSRTLLIPITMSLLGMLNWAFMWFNSDRGMSRFEYANLAATLAIEGIRKLKDGILES